MKATIKTGLSLSATIALAMLSNATLATENPFSANTLESGYQLAQADSKSSEGKSSEGKCGEGKCGAKDDSKKAEGKCGEGKCGAKDDSKKSEG